MIIADDLNRMISPLGDPNALTPNLDRLAARSVCFENATCQYPYCSPSRTAIFMGLYPWLHGNQDAGSQFPNPHAVFPDRIGMPEHFKNNGYWTASYGKTEHHYQARNWDVQTTDHRYPPWRPDYDPDKLTHSQTIWARGITGTPRLSVYELPPEDFVDGVTTSTALNDLTTHLATPDPAPFFVVVGFQAPHDPWDVSQSVFKQYDPAALTIHPNPRGNWPGWAWKINSKQLPLITEELRRELFHAYLTAVTQMDYHLGKILDFLDDNALWNDTVVIFFSDNGWSLCEHEAMYAKRNVTRENVSVPLLVHAPAGLENVTCSRQVELQDLFPTLFDLCALPPYSSYLSGRSIKPLLLDSARAWPHVAKSVISTRTKSNPSAKIAQFETLKIAQGGDPERDMYIDHSVDPFELTPALHARSSPSTDPRWVPLLDSLHSEFGFTVDQPQVFYPRYSTLAPDRDGDGVDDSHEIALAVLGFTPWSPEPERWERLMQGPLPIRDGPGLPGYSLTLPEFAMVRPPGYEAVVFPMDLLESENLRTWMPSDATYEEDPDGTFRWNDSVGSSPQKFFRLVVPRL